MAFGATRWDAFGSVGHVDEAGTGERNAEDKPPSMHGQAEDGPMVHAWMHGRVACTMQGERRMEG